MVQTTTGGGFGGKIDNSVHIFVALLALKTGRPVKLTYTRQESIISSTKRHPFTMRYKLGARKDGKLVAAEVEIFGDTGAYNSYGTAVLTRVATSALGPDEVPNVKIDTYTVYTNNPVSGAMRAFGAPQAAIAHEAIMDELAKKLGISPVEIRRINAFRLRSNSRVRRKFSQPANLYFGQRGSSGSAGCQAAFFWKLSSIKADFGVLPIRLPIGF